MRTSRKLTESLYNNGTDGSNNNATMFIAAL